MPRKPRKKSHGLQFEFRFRGKRYCKTFHDRKAGEEWKRQIQSAAERGEVGIARDGVRFREAIEGFLNERKPHFAVRTYELYVMYRDKHLLDEFGQRQCSDIQTADVTRWLSQKTKDGLSSATTTRMFSLLRAIFNWAIVSGMCVKNPCRAVKLARQAPVRDVRMLDPDEIKSVFSACRSERVKLLVLLGLNTGLRLGEMMGAQWEWIDWRRRTLRVPASLEAGFVPKGKTQREVPLPKSLLDELTARMPESATGPLVSGVNWRRWAEVLRKRSKVKVFRWHILRHTYISRLVMAGVAPRVVQALAGWASINMIDRYAHLAPGAHSAALDALGDGITTAQPGPASKIRKP